MTFGVLLEQLSRCYHSRKWEIHDGIETGSAGSSGFGFDYIEFEVPMEMFSIKLEV